MKAFRAAVLLLCVACAADPVSPSPRFAEAPLSRAAGTDSRAQWFFRRTLLDGVTPTRLYGDGRALDGSALADPATEASGYDGEAQCGVRATINWYSGTSSASGDAFFGPTGGTSALCQSVPRSITVETGTSILSTAWTTRIQQVMQLAVGAGRIQDNMWTPAEGIADCARLRYSVAELGSGVRVTRVSGSSSAVAGRWTVESQGTHLAGCYNFTKGTQLTHTGPDFYLPFSATIVEVLR
jgi:hypothetical protein